MLRTRHTSPLSRSDLVLLALMRRADTRWQCRLTEVKQT
jgi:hypothetical protein